MALNLRTVRSPSPEIKPRYSPQPGLTGEYSKGYSPSRVVATSRCYPPEEPALYEIDEKNSVIAEFTKIVYIPQRYVFASSDKSLVSVGFYACSALVVRNQFSGESLLMHLDAFQDDFEAKGVDGLVWNPDIYHSFMLRPGNKQILLVQGDQSGDFGNIAEALAKDSGSALLPALTVHSGMPNEGHQYWRKKEYRWDIVVRPENGEIVVHLYDVEKKPLLYFTEIFKD